MDFYLAGNGNDGEDILKFFTGAPTLREIMAKEEFWGMDLSTIPGFAEAMEA